MTRLVGEDGGDTGRPHQVLHPHHLLCVLVVHDVHADVVLPPGLLWLDILYRADLDHVLTGSQFPAHEGGAQLGASRPFI